jgi:serine/arginine repetitive matrix protein 2
MSYNGIGLATARGSGTNGYVQRNAAALPLRARRTATATTAAPRVQRGPNAELLLHQQKRQLELKCAELEEKMEAQGYAAEEIEARVAEYRLQLRAALDQGPKAIDPKYGRPPTILTALGARRTPDAPPTSPSTALIFPPRFKSQGLTTFPTSHRNTKLNSHEQAQANEEKNAKLRQAFGIRKDYASGQAFDRDLQQQMREQRKAVRI